jgi:DegV family protein with EDD domain
MKIALLTDSTCDLPEEMLKELMIDFFPLKIIYSDREYRDRVDISPGEIYKNFDKEIPGTSMPGPGEIKEKFIELKEKGFTHIIVIHISSGLSGTYNISKMVSKELKGIIIEVIDSKMLSMGLGRLVLYAKNIIDEGDMEFKDIVQKIKEKIKDIKLFFVVKTLKYLKEGGRIGKVQGTVGELFNIKPIISINSEGQYFTYDKARSRKKSIDTLYKIAKINIMKGLCFVDVMHADAEEEAKKLLDRLKELKNVKDAYLGEISPAMAVHAGPGLIGVSITTI